MKKTCWIDLTDLNHWEGHMTGIQRVTYNLAKHYHQNAAAKFFMFDPISGFHEVSFESVRPKINKATQTAPASKDTDLRRIALSIYKTNSRLLKQSAKYLYRRSPSLIRETAKQKYIDFRAKREPQIIAKLHHPFAHDDVVLIPGASWYRASIILNLGVIKQSVRINIVHVIYDMIPELYPQFFGQGFGDVYIKHMFNAYAISDHLLAISKNTKRDAEAFQEKMLLPKLPVTVFRLGDNPTHGAAKKSPDKRVISGKYLLAVGTLEIRKNYLSLYYVWKKASILGEKLPKLVIVGQPGWLSSDSMYLMHFDPEIRNSIIVLSNVSDDQLAWLYQNCLFTIYPSWYEGWGLPIAESLNYGKLCIASNTSSMPEIGEELIDYFDPFNPLECLSHVIKYLKNPDELVEAEERIKRGYKKVLWDVAYEQSRKVTDSL